MKSLIINKISSVRFNVILKNIKSLLKIDFKDQLITIEKELDRAKKEIDDIKDFIKIISYHNAHPSDEFKNEIAYLTEIGKIVVFPYRQVKTIEKITADFDQIKQLPYVIHDELKRLYFPQKYSVEDARNSYLDFIQAENILGGNYMEKAPHQYQTEQFKVEPGDAVLDIGAAEALFALDVIDIAERVYVFECEEKWIHPLKATFEPYQNKVEIINKIVSDTDSETKVKLDTFFKNKKHSRYFIKMDIEGNEINVIESNRDFFQNNQDVRIACCAYHRQTDADNLKKLFLDMNYKTEYSDGYMLFIYDEIQQPPYFRKGILRASKK